MVRIRLPPAESLRTFGARSRRPADYRTRHAGYGVKAVAWALCPQVGVCFRRDQLRVDAKASIKAAPRRPSGYVTTIGTEPQVAPFRAAITRS